MASEGIPDQNATTAGASGAAPVRRSKRTISAWRANRLWLVLSVVAGIATGGSFLMMSLVFREVGAHPAAITSTAVGGILLLVWIPGRQFFETWQESRRISKLQRRPEPAAD